MYTEFEINHITPSLSTSLPPSPLPSLPPSHFLFPYVQLLIYSQSTTQQRLYLLCDYNLYKRVLQRQRFSCQQKVAYIGTLLAYRGGAQRKTEESSRANRYAVDLQANQKTEQEHRLF